MFWFKLGLLGLFVAVSVGYMFVKREALRKFFGEVRFEMSKVTWPTMDEVTNSTILVTVVTIILALYCLGVDTIFATVVRAFYGG